MTAAGDKTVLRFSHIEENVKRWSAEEPNLYKLVVTLKCGRKTLSAKCIRIGFKR